MPEPNNDQLLGPAHLAELDERFGHILPEGCSLRGVAGGGKVAALCLRAHLALTAPDVDSAAFRDVLGSVIDGGWRLPVSIHNRHCPCGRELQERAVAAPAGPPTPPERASRTPLLAPGPPETYIEQFGLPTRLAPERRGELTLYAQPIPSATDPRLEVRCFLGADFETATVRATALFSPRDSRWRIVVFRPGSPLGTELEPTDDCSFALATIRHLVGAHATRA